MLQPGKQVQAGPDGLKLSQGSSAGVSDQRRAMLPGWLSITCVPWLLRKKHFLEGKIQLTCT